MTVNNHWDFVLNKGDKHGPAIHVHGCAKKAQQEAADAELETIICVHCIPMCGVKARKKFNVFPFCLLTCLQRTQWQKAHCLLSNGHLQYMHFVASVTPNWCCYQPEDHETMVNFAAFCKGCSKLFPKIGNHFATTQRMMLKIEFGPNEHEP
jgi:hypothetical protein